MAPVAVVGSGMAGLVTAYLLHKDPHQRYAVKLFESVSDRLCYKFMRVGILT